MLIEELARAKVNLTLQVLGRRQNGYHELASVVAFASIGDKLVLDTSRPVAVEITGPFAPKLASEYLISRTLDALLDRHPGLVLGSVSLDKRLPVAAGIGGGSADAAAVLRAVRRANSDVADAVDWLDIAASLGADVPVCFANSLTFMTGTGATLKSLPPLQGNLSAVLVNPKVVVPPDKTAQVFRSLNAPPAPSMLSATQPGIADADQAIQAIARIGNDLEAPAEHVMPAVRDVLAALRDLSGCRVARMSGAGPTCFAIVDDAPAAAALLRERHPEWWVEPVLLS